MVADPDPPGREFLDAARARARALELIDRDTQALDAEHSFETEHCWVFCYNSKRYVETRDLEAALIGNAPIILSKLDGSLVPSGTAEPVASYVARYERSLNKPWWKFW